MWRSRVNKKSKQQGILRFDINPPVSAAEAVKPATHEPGVRPGHPAGYLVSATHEPLWARPDIQTEYPAGVSLDPDARGPLSIEFCFDLHIYEI